MRGMNAEQRHQQAKRATGISAIINTLLGFLKLLMGIIGQSQALIADGVHSFSDLLSDALVLFASKAGNKSPDEDHPYGHRRIETLAAIVIAFILIAVGTVLAGNTIRLLWHHQQLPTPSILALLAALISIGANEWLYRYTLRVADRINSNLLRSNAWHNRSDAFTSIIVFISVLGQLLGIPHLDAIGAIIISIVIINMGGRMAWQGIAELIDTAVEPEELEKIKASIDAVPGVEDVHQLRTRLSGGNIYVDVHILVDPMISVSEGHYIGDQVYLALKKQHSKIIDVTVHIDPEDDEKAKPSIDLPDRPTVLAWLAENGKDLPGFKDRSNVRMHYFDGNILLDITLPISLRNHESIEHEYNRVLTTHSNIAKVFVYFR